METIDGLLTLVHSLKRGEVVMLRNYYRYLITYQDTGKRLELFNLLKTNKNITDKDACWVLYKKDLHSAYSHLKSRLKKDVLNILLTQDSKRRFNTLYAQAEFDARRLIIEGDILISRGVMREGLKALNKAIELGDKFELFQENAIAYDILLMHLTIKKGAKTYNLYQKKLLSNTEIATVLAKAKDYHYKILSPHIFKITDEKDQIQFAKKAMLELKTDYEKSKATKIGYYYFYISIFYFSLTKSYLEANKFAKRFLEMIMSSKALYSKRSIAAANLQLAFISLQLSHYNESIKYAENALRNFRKGLINELTTLEIYFLAHYYLEHKKANVILKQALQHPKLNANDFLPAKWHFYKAWQHFKNKQFDAAYRSLINCSVLLDDKTGWLYGYKILDMMITLESSEQFLVDAKVANFKKIIGKHKNINSARAKTILRILEILVRKHFDYDITYKNQKANIDILKEAKNDYLWEPMGYELIRFEEWFLSKVKKKLLA